MTQEAIKAKVAVRELSTYRCSTRLRLVFAALILGDASFIVPSPVL